MTKKEFMQDLLHNGWSYGEIGNAFGLTRQRIHAICGKTTISKKFGGMTKEEVNGIMKEINKLK